MRTKISLRFVYYSHLYYLLIILLFLLFSSVKEETLSFPWTVPEMFSVNNFMKIVECSKEVVVYLINKLDDTEKIKQVCYLIEILLFVIFVIQII
jgi:hypothetical protein